jgi:hypothetical protein
LKSSTASGTDIGPRHSIASPAMACTPGGMVNPSGLCGPEVDDQLEFRRQFDRQVTALLGRSELKAQRPINAVA